MWSRVETRRKTEKCTKFTTMRARCKGDWHAILESKPMIDLNRILLVKQSRITSSTGNKPGSNSISGSTFVCLTPARKRN